MLPKCYEIVKSWGVSVGHRSIVSGQWGIVIGFFNFVRSSK